MKQGGQEPDQLFCSRVVLVLSPGRGTLVRMARGGGHSPPSLPSQGHTGRQHSTSGQVAGLASHPGPMPEGKTEHSPWTGDVWARLCGEWAARKEENLAGMGWEGEGVSVELHSGLPPHPRNTAVLGTETAQPALSAVSTY